MQDFLAKLAVELLTGGAGFYSIVFMVPNQLGNLCPIPNLKPFNHYMHIPSFRMPSIKQVWQLIQQGNYAFSIALKDAYLHAATVKHHHFL